MKQPKPRKKQIYPELWYRPDIDSLYFVPIPPHLPQYLNEYSNDPLYDWQNPSFCSAIFRLKGKAREAWGKFEFIGEIK